MIFPVRGFLIHDRQGAGIVDAQGDGSLDGDMVPRQAHQREQAVAPILAGAVKDAVAQAVEDGTAMVLLDGLRDVGMVADDQVGASIDGEMRDPPLARGGGRVNTPCPSGWRR